MNACTLYVVPGLVMSMNMRYGYSPVKTMSDHGQN